MSYRRSYSATISGTVHGSYSYPASESGGSGSISLNWAENVYVDIDVDTSSFDHGVGTLKHHIDVLTGSVAATEAAQIQEKVRGAIAIGESVTHGFFDLIRSEITQQTAALKSRVDSLLLKLKDIKLACLRVRQTMQQDYARITDRYASTFTELDRELATRIASLDEAVYALVRDVSSQEGRSYDSTLSTVPTLFAAENSRAQGILTAGAIRSQMNSLLQGAVAYLVSEKKTRIALSSMLTAETVSDAEVCSLPVAYLKADEPSAVPSERIFLPSVPALPSDSPGLQNKITESFRQRDLSWKPLSDQARAQIERFFIPLVEGIQTQTPERDARVRRAIDKLWSAHLPESLSL